MYGYLIHKFTYALIYKFAKFMHIKIWTFKNWLSFFVFFSFFSSRCESYHKLETGHPIALKFGTQKGGKNQQCLIIYAIENY